MIDNIVILANLVAECETKLNELTECISKVQELIKDKECLTKQ